MFYALGSVQVSVAPFLIAILTTFVLCVLTLAVVSLLDSDAETPLGRALQKLRLSRLRMGRMLRSREVNLAQYASMQSVATLKRQAEACIGCDRTETCDRALKSLDHGLHSHTRYTFCPNHPAIEHYIQFKTAVAGTD